MPSGNPNIAKAGEKTRFKPGQSGNPTGPKPGYKHISTWIQELLNDEQFETTLLDAKQGIVEYKGAPLKAILQTQMHLALHSRDEAIRIKATDLLAKYGYGTKTDITSDGKPLNMGMTQEQAEQLINLRARRGTD